MNERLQKLFDKGYRQVSRKYCTIARIDISPSEFENWLFDKGWFKKHPANRGIHENHYRRCCSGDTEELSETDMVTFSKLGDYRIPDKRMSGVAQDTELGLLEKERDFYKKVMKEALKTLDEESRNRIKSKYRKQNFLI